MYLIYSSLLKIWRRWLLQCALANATPYSMHSISSKIILFKVDVWCVSGIMKNQMAPRLLFFLPFSSQILLWLITTIVLFLLELLYCSSLTLVFVGTCKEAYPECLSDSSTLRSWLSSHKRSIQRSDFVSTDQLISKTPRRMPTGYGQKSQDRHFQGNKIPSLMMQHQYSNGSWTRFLLVLPKQ